MTRQAGRWVGQVAVATATLAAIGLFADPSQAAAAPSTAAVVEAGPARPAAIERPSGQGTEP